MLLNSCYQLPTVPGQEVRGRGVGVGGGATTTQSMMEMPLTSLSDLLMNHQLLGVINPMQSDSKQGGLG